MTIFKFFPKPSELLDLLNGKEDEQATIAWLRVHKAVKDIGPYESVDFTDDRVINSTIEAMGGWVNLCKVSLDEWKWKRKEFEGLYHTMAKRNNGGHPISLPGIVEIDNMPRGFSVPDVKRLMTPDKSLMLH